jgi:tape measure domain-containing protein
MAAQQLDALSLGTLGGTLQRITADATRLQDTLRGLSGAMSTGLNVNTANLAVVPGQLNAVAASAQNTAKAVLTVADAFQQGFQLNPGQLAGELKRQAAEAEAIQQQAIQAQLAHDKAYAEQMFQGRQALASTLLAIQRQGAQVEEQEQTRKNLAFIAMQEKFHERVQQMARQSASYQQQQLAPRQQDLVNVLQQRVQQLTTVTPTSGALAAPGQTPTSSFLEWSTAVQARQQQAIAAQAQAQVNATQTVVQATQAASGAFLGLTAQQTAVVNNALQGARTLSQALSNLATQTGPQSPGSALPPGAVTIPGIPAQGIAPQYYIPGVQAGLVGGTPGVLPPAAQQTFLSPGTLYAQPQIQASPAFAASGAPVTGIAISNNQVYQQVGTGAGQTATQLQILQRAFASTNVSKHALDTNMGAMSSSNGSLWRMHFGLQLLAGTVAALTFRALIDDATKLAEALIETQQSLERATALFSLMKDSSMTAAEGIDLATSTAQELGLAVLPAIEGLGKMQAAAYGTAAAGKIANEAFVGMMTALGSIGADAQSVTSAMNALAQSISRQDVSSRTIRQLNAEFPGFKERIAEAFGSQSVQEFMITLDKGRFTMTQYLRAFQEAFTAQLAAQAHDNVNKMTGAVTAFHNAILQIQQAMLAGGFAKDVIQGIKDLAAVLSSPAVLDAARQFGYLFGVAIKGTLETFAYILELAAQHTTAFAAIVGTLVSSGLLIGFASAIGAIAFAVQALNISLVPMLVGLGTFALIGGAAAAALVYFTQKSAETTTTTTALTKGLAGLTEGQKSLGAALPTEHLQNYEKFQEDVRSQTDRLVAQTAGYRGELDLLQSGIDKNSAAFTGLAEVQKLVTKYAADLNVMTDAQRTKLENLAIASANYQQTVAKLAQNKDQLKSLRDDTAITQRLTELASGGATEGILAIERKFQDDFQRMKDHFADLIYNERDADARRMVIEDFKAQATALRDASLQAQLYANRLKAIQDLNTGAENLQFEREINKIWDSVNDDVTRYSEKVTNASPSAIASFRPASITPASDTIQAYMFQLDRANIGSQRQTLNGPVEMSIMGPVTIRSVGTGGGQAMSSGPATGKYGDFMMGAGAQYSIDPRLIQAVAHVESGMNSRAVSPEGAQGLMQLMPGTARDMRVTDPFDPQQNIYGGTQYLRQMLTRSHGNIPEALAAYNAGPGPVHVGGGVPNIPETQKYVRDVIAEYLRLGGEIATNQMATLTPANLGTGTGVSAAGMTGDSVRQALEWAKKLLGYGGFSTRKEVESQMTESLGLEGRYQKTVNDLFNSIVEEMLKGEPSQEVLAKLHGRLETLMGLAVEKAPTTLPANPPITIEKSFTGETMYDVVQRRKQAEAAAEAQRQRDLERLSVTQQGLQPSLLSSRGQGFAAGQITTTRQPRTALEAERDEAGVRAVREFNRNVLIAAPQYALERYQFSRATPAQETALQAPRSQPADPAFVRDLLMVEQLRKEAESQGRVGFEELRDRELKKATLSIADQNREMKTSIEFLGQDARYRDIDAKAAEALRKAEESNFPTANLERMRQLIREHARLEKSYQDLNGPLQKYKDTLLGLKDIDVGVQQVAVAAVQNLAQNYLNVQNVQSMLQTEKGKRDTAAQTDAVLAENRRYASAIQQVGRQANPTTAAEAQALNTQLVTLRAHHEELLAVAQDTTASFSGFQQVGFLFQSFANTIIESLEKMVIEMLIVKPLVAELQGALSGQGVSGGFADTFGGLFGGGESAFGSELGGMTTSAETLAGLESSIADIGKLSTGGYATLQGIRHFAQGGGTSTGTDTIPALLSPGEVVLNAGQQRALGKSMQGGGNTYVFSPTIHAQDSESVRKTMPQLQNEFYRSTERMAKRNNIRGT